MIALGRRWMLADLLLKKRMSQAEAARQLKVHRSTVNRDVDRMKQDWPEIALLIAGLDILANADGNVRHWAKGKRGARRKTKRLRMRSK